MISMTNDNDAAERDEDLEPGPIDDPDLVSIREAAKALGLSWPTVQGWANRGIIRKYQRAAGGHIRVRLSEVREKARYHPVDEREKGG